MFVESVSIDDDAEDFSAARSPSIPSWPEICVVLFNHADAQVGLDDRHDASGWAFLVSTLVQLKD